MQACLEDDNGKQYFLLKEESFLVGGDNSCHLKLSGRLQNVANIHAHISFKDDDFGQRYVLTDMSGTRNTFVNGKKIKKKILKSGDKLVFGNDTITFVFQLLLTKVSEVERTTSIIQEHSNDKTATIVKRQTTSLLPLPGDNVAAINTIKKKEDFLKPVFKELSEANKYHFAKDTTQKKTKTYKHTTIMIPLPEETVPSLKKLENTKRRDKINYCGDEIRLGALEGHRLQEKLMSGDMCSVYLAREMENKQKRIVKFLTLTDSANFKRFVQEMRINLRLEHPNIAQVYGFDTTSRDIWFFVMEFVDGFDLDTIIEFNGPFAPKFALEIVFEVLAALEYALSQKIIHRDLKPANIVLEKETFTVKLIDFGIGKILGESKITKPNQIFGTLYYMSPEQLKDTKSIDHRADIYSLGATLYHMLCGRYPYWELDDDDVKVMSAIFRYPPSPIQKLEQDVPVAVSRIVEKAMARDVENRYQSPGEMMLDIQEVWETL